MADQYTTVAGTIQWDVEPREVNGKPIREFSIRSLVSGQLVKVTLWDQFANSKVNKGDFVVVDGKVTQNEGQDKAGNRVVYNNLSATGLVVIEAEEKIDTPRTTVNTAPEVDVSNII